MLQNKKHRLWTVGFLVLTLFFFLAGTSLACFQKGTRNITVAKACCQGHCQHAMTGEVATDCCQSHHPQVSHAFPSSSPAKTFILAVSTLPVALISPATLQSLEHPWIRRSIEEPSSPSPPFYTLHCALLI